ncbi:MAG: CusA/CzcA family heavy metal efflux RND transporter [Candidatus Micrarchaeota archaeon]|nr:CusA/CzcA family heavy metal efflux RND transporter [Candidatus Micrarchaeota archaeon]
MNKLVFNIVTFSLKNRITILFATVIIVIWGIISFINTPIEAFPDVTNTQIIIVTQWPGRSAEEVERFITIPIELAMNPVQKKTSVRSVTMFGLSIVTIIFEDDVEDFFARQQVNNQLRNLNLPPGAEPEVQPPYGPTGEIFRYTLESKTRNVRDLLTIQNWVIERELKSVPGVADVVSFGGEQKTYEVQLNPILLSKYDLTPLDVYEALTKANINVGGDVIERNNQAFVVRGIGLINSKEDLENVIVDDVNGTPLLVKHLAVVKESALPRVGQAGRNLNDDVVEGIIVMRKNENPSEVLKRVKEKIQELNEKILPSDVKMITFYDRDKLMHYTTHTVLSNLAEGIILVTVIVFIFMAEWRTTLIVALVIPLSLLFAFIMMRLKGMTANLLSLGAVDFGIIIDGAVVMVEGIFVTLDHLAHKIGMEKFNKLLKYGIIRRKGGDLGKAIFFSKLIIITALLPIFSFEKVEGKMFSPLAYTLGFALLGALLFTLTLIPVLISLLFNKNVKEKKNIFVEWIQKNCYNAFLFCFKYSKIALISVAGIFLIVLLSAKKLGTEFLPTLNEGALWITAKLPMSASLNESIKMTRIIKKKLLQFPEIEEVLDQIGRSNDGTDPNGFYFVQIQVNLYPKEKWKKKKTLDELIAEIDKELSQIQGINYNYSQPIIDNVAEAVAGVKANNAIRIYGNDLQVLDTLANEVLKRIKDVPGVKDIGILKNIGQPEYRILLDESKMAAYGVRTADANAVIEMAIGGKTASMLYEGEKKFDIRLRFAPEFRSTEEDIMNIRVPTIAGGKVLLKEIATFEKITGPAFIYRYANKRIIAVKFSVRERDLGSTIKDAQNRVKDLKLPKGYSMNWVGEFENQVRASNRLGQVIPISLIAIFIILFIMLGNTRDSLLVLLNVPFSVVGGILALHITGINFGISAGVGFIALLGICIQNGVILTQVFKNNFEKRMPLHQSITEGVRTRIRPIVMTALMAMIGLLPAAVSTGIGSESQKPLAIVVIGGLFTATLFTLFIFPIVFEKIYKKFG